MQTPAIRERHSLPSAEAWGAGFVHALREVRAATPTPATGSVRPTPGPARVVPQAPQASSSPSRARPGGLWERLLGLVGDALRGVLDLLRSGVDAALRALGGR
jgi:hypothetical protein